jgi:intron-binding protein aquarius
MEESAQILEIETFIPILLQRPEDGHSRLKRVVLLGDHHQLPPVVKNAAFQRYCRMDQSLFSRLVRLGVPTLQLNSQGRARPSIAALYSWRYAELGNLPCVSQGAYRHANAGLAFEAQWVDVAGKESEPTPHFTQNLAEAEYLVSVYQYMRLLGHPASSISMLTTYNGQKHLLRDVVAARCASHPLFGSPAAICTVDQYQGQQNDYVLLSLVRSRAVGHLRDVRRLVVAMSRARLGLYVFGRAELFGGVCELQPALGQLLARPTQLALVPTEQHPTQRAVEDSAAQGVVLVEGGSSSMGALVNGLLLRWQAQQQLQTTPAGVKQ